MEKFVVTFQVKDDDKENEHLFDTMQQEVEAKDLDSLHKILYEGLQNETFKSELESGIEGDINVEYVIIHDSKGNEVYRDEDSLHKDYKDELPNQEMSVGVFFYLGKFSDNSKLLKVLT